MNPCDTFCREALHSAVPAEPASPEVERLCRLLGQAALFNGLACTDIARFARGVRELKVAKGDILFHRGDPCTGFHLILSGQVKLAFTSADGNEKVVDILYPGKSFGEAVMFMDKPYVVMAQALSDATLLHIGKQVFFEEMAGDPMFCRKIIAGLAQRLHHLMADVESYSLRSGRERVIGYLLRELSEADQNGTAVAVTLPTNKGVIASRLNLTQEHFSRILHELTELGLIVVEGRKIHIPSVASLRKHEG